MTGDEMVAIPPIPDEFFEIAEQMKRDIEMVCGVHPQVLGEPERGARTATSCELLTNWRPR